MLRHWSFDAAARSSNAAAWSCAAGVRSSNATAWSCAADALAWNAAAWTPAAATLSFEVGPPRWRGGPPRYPCLGSTGVSAAAPTSVTGPTEVASLGRLAPQAARIYRLGRLEERNLSTPQDPDPVRLELFRLGASAIAGQPRGAPGHVAPGNPPLCRSSGGEGEEGGEAAGPVDRARDAGFAQDPGAAEAWQAARPRPRLAQRCRGSGRGGAPTQGSLRPISMVP